MLLQPLAHGQEAAFARFGGCVEFGDIGWGRRRRRAEQHLHHPLPAEHGRCPVGVRRKGQDAAVAEKTAPRGVDVLDAPEVVAGDSGDAVVPRQAFVHVRVVGREQV